MKMREFGKGGESVGVEYCIESGYILKFTYDGIEEDNFTEGEEPYVVVLCANGEWKLDIHISIIKDTIEAALGENYEE